MDEETQPQLPPEHDMVIINGRRTGRTSSQRRAGTGIMHQLLNNPSRVQVNFNIEDFTQNDVMNLVHQLEAPARPNPSPAMTSGWTPAYTVINPAPQPATIDPVTGIADYALQEELMTQEEIERQRRALEQRRATGLPPDTRTPAQILEEQINAFLRDREAAAAPLPIAEPVKAELPEDPIEEKPWIIGVDMLPYKTKKEKWTYKAWRILLQEICPVLDALFPERWHFEFVERSDEFGNSFWRRNLIVKYDEITLSRKGDNATHRIENLFVKLRFSDNLSITGEVQGTRSSITDLEYLGSYAHSHLDNDAKNQFTSFCQGDTVFRDLLTKLGSNGFFKETHTYTDEPSLKEDVALQFEGLLHQLGAYVSHEATEGRPHLYYKQIGTGSSNGVNSGDVQTNVLRFLTLFEKNKELPIHFQNNVPYLTNNEELEKYLLQICTHYQFKDNQGNYYSDIVIPSNIRSMTKNRNFVSFNFRGETVTQTITHPVKADETVRTKYCHRQIRDTIVSKINGQISQDYSNIFFDRAYERNLEVERAEREGKASDTPESILEALVPVNSYKSHRVLGSDVLQDDSGEFVHP